LLHRRCSSLDAHPLKTGRHQLLPEQAAPAFWQPYHIKRSSL
jgi:hypothetical protein